MLLRSVASLGLRGDITPLQLCHPVASLCLCVSFRVRTASCWIGIHPNGLILITSDHDPVSGEGYIHSCLQLGLQHIFRVGHSPYQGDLEADCSSPRVRRPSLPRHLLIQGLAPFDRTLPGRRSSLPLGESFPFFPFLLSPHQAYP